MQTRARVMFDAASLLRQSEGFPIDESEDDQEKTPLLPESNQELNLRLATIGSLIRTYEIGKLLSMGFSHQTIYALIELEANNSEFPSTIQTVIDRQQPTKHAFQ